MPGLDQLKHLYGRQLALDKDDNLIIQGTKIGYGRDGAATSIDLAALGAANSSIPNAAFDGVTDDSSALSTALTSIGSTRANLQIAGPLLVNANVTIPSNVQLTFFGGGMLKPAASKTLTINGAISAGPWQIFDTSLGGTIAGTPRVDTIYDAWFGTDPTGVAACGALFNKVFVLAHGAGDVPVTTVAGTYNTSDAMILVNGVTNGSFSHPNWICPAGPKKTTLSYAGQSVGVALRGGSGQLSHGYIWGLGFSGDANSIGLQFDGQCGAEARNCRFDTNYIGVQYANIRSGAFTEYCHPTENCEWTNNCQYAEDFTRTTGNSSFHGSGSRGRGAHNFFPASSLTATAAFVGGETSLTLNANWTGHTDPYTIFFSSGEYRRVTLTNGQSSASWTGALTLPATTTVVAASAAVRIGAGCNVYTASHDVQHWAPSNPSNGYYTIFQNNNVSAPLNPSFVGELSIEGANGRTWYLGDPTGNVALFVNSSVRVNGLNNGPGGNVLPGSFLRCQTAGISFDSTVSFTGGVYSQFLGTSKTILVTSPLNKTHRLADLQVNIGTSYIYKVTLDPDYIQSGSTAFTPATLDTTPPRYSTDANTLGAPTLSGNTDGSWNIIPPSTSLTFTIAPTGTSGTLNANWTKPNGTYPITFSDNEVRNAVLANGATSADWSADSRGALTGSPTTAATATNWPATGISIYVTEWQQNTGTNGGGHHLF